MRIGYARASSDDQHLDLQLDALKQAGCERSLYDHASGSNVARPGLDQTLGLLREGDTLIVWRLDRLSRSLRDLIDLVGNLEAQGIGLCSLQEAIDTIPIAFQVLGVLATCANVNHIVYLCSCHSHSCRLPRI